MQTYRQKDEGDSMSRNCKQFGGSALECLRNSGVLRNTDWKNSGGQIIKDLCVTE